ncbi:MAG TPA: hypothetical protein P5533_01490 [Candidatus Cloacimonadota bacterium]|nr:hypothetical protein [Candidatus Cloacimonadota bacterium]
MRPTSLTSFTCDSISLNVAVYDDQNAPFILGSYPIENAELIFPALTQTYPADEINKESNTISFFVPNERIREPGLTPFFIRLTGPDLQFTIAYGNLNVIDPVKVNT